MCAFLCVRLLVGFSLFLCVCMRVCLLVFISLLVGICLLVCVCVSVCCLNACRAQMPASVLVRP